MIFFSRFNKCFYIFRKTASTISTTRVKEFTTDTTVRSNTFSNIINIFQPEILVIGGGICNEKNYLTDPLKTIIKEETYGNEGIKPTELKIAELGNDAGIIGAAVLGL